MRRVVLFGGLVIIVVGGFFSTENVSAESDYAEIVPFMEILGDPAHQSIEAFAIFDDFYYVGMHWVAAYVLDTGDGLVVIDALYDDWVEHVVRGIEKMGLDPKDIKYVLCTHGHFDHAGGAKVLQDRYGAKVLMTAEDIELVKETQGDPVLHFEMADYDVAEDRDVIELGNKRITLYKTPGHTWGTMSIKYQVTDGEQRYTAMTLGGVGRNFSGVAQTEAYIKSYQRLIEMQDDIHVSMPSHAFMTELFAQRNLLLRRQARDVHPFVNPDAYKASLASFLAQAKDKLVQEQRGAAMSPVETLKKLLAPLVEKYQNQK